MIIKLCINELVSDKNHTLQSTNWQLMNFIILYNNEFSSDE